MKSLKTNSITLITDGILDFYAIQQYKDILQFVVEDVDLSGDVSAPKSKVDLDNAPHLKQPLSKCDIQDSIRKQIVVAMPQQMGKSLLQFCTLLYNCCYNSLQAIVLYPSTELASETNATKMIPLFKSIPQFQQDIEKPFAIRSDRLRLSNALIYFSGAGTKCVSRSCKLVCGDQCAVWLNPPNINNIEQLKKRTRSYNQCLQLFVSTPSYKQNPFWKQFLQGSQGYYYLRCQHCHNLTMRSCDIHNLQFETVYNEELKLYQPVLGSCRLVCPQCKHEHTEADRENMIKQGGYIHRFADRVTTRPSYQCGALASLLNVHNWDNIAQIQLASGKSAQLSDYVSFDNSIRGLPYQQRQYDKQSETALSKHYYDDIPADKIQCIYITADTQDTFSPYAVFALTSDNNIYVIQMGRKRYLWLQDDQRNIINAENKRNNKAPQVTLLDVLDKQYYGIKPLCMMVDMRGHRTDEIKQFAKMRKNIIMYGGTQLKYQPWKISDNNNKLFLVNEKTFRAELIFKLYFYQNKQQSYLYLPSNISQQDIAEIVCVQPDNTKRNGNLYENWQPKSDAVHDMFDTLKMGYALLKIIPKIYRKDKFKFGTAKCLQSTTPAKQKPQNQHKTIPHRPIARY